MAEGIKNSKHLQHGDIIALVCDGPLGYDGFLSSASSSVKEIGSDLRVSYEPSVQVEAGAFSPEFQSTSLWRVDSSTGESAPGEPVIFGNTVRLHLVRTRQFLKATNSPMKENKRNCSLDLSRTKTKDCQFHILPQLKMRSEGEIVYYGEPIRICDLDGSFVCNNGSPSTPHYPPEGPAAAALNRPAPTVVYSTSEGDAQHWRLHLFQAWQPRLETALKAGDLLRLFHMEDEAFLVGQVSDAGLRVRGDLALDDNANEKLSALYGRRFRDREATFADPRVSFVGLRRTKVKRRSRVKRSLCSVWEVQLESGDIGGPICFGARIRLRHFVSGSYLAFRAPSSPSAPSLVASEGSTTIEDLEKEQMELLAGAHGELKNPPKPMLLSAIDTPHDRNDSLFTFEYVSVSETTIAGSSSSNGSQKSNNSSGAGGGGDDATSQAPTSKPVADSDGRAVVNLLSLGHLKHAVTGQYITSHPTTFADLLNGRGGLKAAAPAPAATPAASKTKPPETAARTKTPAAAAPPAPTDEAKVDQAMLDDMHPGGGLHPDLHHSPSTVGGSRWKRVKDSVLNAVHRPPDEGAYAISAVQPAEIDTFFFLRAQTNVITSFIESALFEVETLCRGALQQAQDTILKADFGVGSKIKGSLATQEQQSKEQGDSFASTEKKKTPATSTNPPASSIQGNDTTNSVSDAAGAASSTSAFSMGGDSPQELTDPYLVKRVVHAHALIESLTPLLAAALVHSGSLGAGRAAFVRQANAPPPNNADSGDHVAASSLANFSAVMATAHAKHLIEAKKNATKPPNVHSASQQGGTHAATAAAQSGAAQFVPDQGFGDVSATIQDCCSALTELIGFASGVPVRPLGSLKALDVSSAPSKSRQNSMIEEGIVELLLMLSQQCFAILKLHAAVHSALERARDAELIVTEDLRARQATAVNAISPSSGPLPPILSEFAILFAQRNAAFVAAAKDSVVKQEEAAHNPLLAALFSHNREVLFSDHNDDDEAAAASVLAGNSPAESLFNTDQAWSLYSGDGKVGLFINDGSGGNKGVELDIGASVGALKDGMDSVGHGMESMGHGFNSGFNKMGNSVGSTNSYFNSHAAVVPNAESSTEVAQGTKGGVRFPGTSLDKSNEPVKNRAGRAANSLSGFAAGSTAKFTQKMQHGDKAKKDQDESKDHETSKPESTESTAKFSGEPRRSGTDVDPSMDSKMVAAKVIGAVDRQAKTRLPGPRKLHQVSQLAYHALRMIVTGNKKSLPHVMDAMGVDTMVKHKIKKGIPAAFTEEWEPPIRAVLKTYSDAGAGGESVNASTPTFNSAANIVNKTDILFLLDKCFERMYAGHRPDADLYSFLASICELNQNSRGPEVQRWTRELLLGNSALIARESCFFHQMRLVPVKQPVQPPSSPANGPSTEHGGPSTKSHRGSFVGSAASGLKAGLAAKLKRNHSAKTKSSDSVQEATKTVFVVEVEMARWGKRRPTFSPDSRPDSSEKSSGAGSKGTAAKVASATQKKKSYPRLSPEPGVSYEEWRDSASDETLVEAKKTWRPLAALDVAECRIITANFRLLAMLCAGSGSHSSDNEAIIKKLVSVDLLLEMLDQLSDLGKKFATRVPPPPPPPMMDAYSPESPLSAKRTQDSNKARASAKSPSKGASNTDAGSSDEPTPVEDSVLREEYAAMHTSVVLLLINLFVQSTRLSTEMAQRKSLRPTLVWGVGTGQDMPEDYEVALASLSNRVFSAATQLDEPKLMSELNDYMEARAIIRSSDPAFLSNFDERQRVSQNGQLGEGIGADEATTTTVGGNSASASATVNPSGGTALGSSGLHEDASRKKVNPDDAAEVFERAKTILREQWSEFMVVDLWGFRQRARLRGIIFRTLEANTAQQANGNDYIMHRNSVWLECMTTFLTLTRDLMRVNFFSCLYDEFPRSRLLLNGKLEFPFFYSMTKAMRATMVAASKQALARGDSQNEFGRAAMRRRSSGNEKSFVVGPEIEDDKEDDDEEESHDRSYFGNLYVESARIGLFVDDGHGGDIGVSVNLEPMLSGARHAADATQKAVDSGLLAVDGALHMTESAKEVSKGFNAGLSAIGINKKSVFSSLPVAPSLAATSAKNESAVNETAPRTSLASSSDTAAAQATPEGSDLWSMLDEDTNELPGGAFRRAVKLEPFGVLGHRGDANGQEVLNVAPDPRALPGGCCVVDSASLRCLRPPGRPSDDGGGSRAVYEWCGLVVSPPSPSAGDDLAGVDADGGEEFPAAVRYRVRGEGDAHYHAYRTTQSSAPVGGDVPAAGHGDTVTKSDGDGGSVSRATSDVSETPPAAAAQVASNETSTEATTTTTTVQHVIHVLSPDLHSLKREAAVEVLGKAYRNVLAQFVASGQACLRLIPLGSGKRAGPQFRSPAAMASITDEALREGFVLLSPSQQASIAAATVQLCLYDEISLAAFTQNGFRPSALALRVLRGEALEPGHASSNSSMGDGNTDGSTRSGTENSKTSTTPRRRTRPPPPSKGKVSASPAVAAPVTSPLKSIHHVKRSAVRGAVRAFTVQPYGVLGSRVDYDGVAVTGVGPDPADLRACCVVDSTDLSLLPAPRGGNGGPKRATHSSSKAIYQWAGLTHEKTFPDIVSDSLRGIGDSCHCTYHKSGAEDTRKDLQDEAHVIHALAPDFRGDHPNVDGKTSCVSSSSSSSSPTKVAPPPTKKWTPERAVASLAICYRNVLAAFVASGMEVLRLPVLSSGARAGQFYEEVPRLTMEALGRGILLLSATQQASLQASDLQLCVPFEADLAEFANAGFALSLTALNLVEALNGGSLNLDSRNLSGQGSSVHGVQLAPAHAVVRRQAMCPALQMGGEIVVPARERIPVDALFYAAVPEGMSMRCVVKHEERILVEEDDDHLLNSIKIDGAEQSTVTVLMPSPGTDDWNEITTEDPKDKRPERRKPMELVELIRHRLVAIQELLNPRTDPEPQSLLQRSTALLAADSSNGSDNKDNPKVLSQRTSSKSLPGKWKDKWLLLAKDPSLAEAHFNRMYGLSMKSPEDGLIQSFRKTLQRIILETWYLTVDVNQTLRVKALWKSFTYTFVQEVQRKGLGAAEGSDDAMIYLEHAPMTSKLWKDFELQAQSNVRGLINSLERHGHPALFGDFVSSPKNDKDRIDRGGRFLDLLLYEDPRLSAEAVFMLSRHFNRRVELSTLLLKDSTMVLDPADRNTVTFVRVRKTLLSRHLAQFGDPHANKREEHDLWVATGRCPLPDPKALNLMPESITKQLLTRRQLLEERRLAQMAILGDIIMAVLNDPSEHNVGKVGLMNLCWTRPMPDEMSRYDVSESVASEKGSKHGHLKAPSEASRKSGRTNRTLGVSMSDISGATSDVVDEDAAGDHEVADAAKGAVAYQTTERHRAKRQGGFVNGVLVRGADDVAFSNKEREKYMTHKLSTNRQRHAATAAVQLNQVSQSTLGRFYRNPLTPSLKARLESIKAAESKTSDAATSGSENHGLKMAAISQEAVHAFGLTSGVNASAGMVNHLAGVPYLLRTAEEKIFSGVSFHDLPQRERLEEVNQSILANEGVHLPLIDFLHRIHADVHSKQEHTNAFSAPMAEVIRVCYVFLFYFTWQNPANALLLSTKPIMQMLCKQLKWWDGLEVALLLTNILTNNDTANALLSHFDVENIVDLLVEATKEEADKQAASASLQRAAHRFQAKARTSTDDAENSSEGSDGTTASAAAAEAPPSLDRSQVPREDWRRANIFVMLLKALVESEKGSIEARQEQVMVELEKHLRINAASTTRGNTNAGDGQLLAALLFLRPPVPLSELQAGGGIDFDGDGIIDDKDENIATNWRSSTVLTSEEESSAANYFGATQVGHDRPSAEEMPATSELAIGKMIHNQLLLQYSFVRVEKAFAQRISGSDDPNEQAEAMPRSFEDKDDWMQWHSHAGEGVRGGGSVRSLNPTEHLAFHLEFLDLLAMLAKSSDRSLEQWCSSFVSERELLLGLRSRFGRLRSYFIRFFHGLYFCRPFDLLADGLVDTAGSSDLGGSGVEHIFDNHSDVIMNMFHDMNNAVRLAVELQELELDPIWDSHLFAARQEHEDKVFNVVVPFMADFFKGGWALRFNPYGATEEEDEGLQNDARLQGALSHRGGVKGKKPRRVYSSANMTRAEMARLLSPKSGSSLELERRGSGHMPEPTTLLSTPEGEPPKTPTESTPGTPLLSGEVNSGKYQLGGLPENASTVGGTLSEAKELPGVDTPHVEDTSFADLQEEAPEQWELKALGGETAFKEAQVRAQATIAHARRPSRHNTSDTAQQRASLHPTARYAVGRGRASIEPRMYFEPPKQETKMRSFLDPAATAAAAEAKERSDLRRSTRQASNSGLTSKTQRLSRSNINVPSFVNGQAPPKSLKDQHVLWVCAQRPHNSLVLNLSHLAKQAVTQRNVTLRERMKRSLRASLEAHNIKPSDDEVNDPGSSANGDSDAINAPKWEMLAKDSVEWDAVQSALKALAAFEAKQGNGGKGRDLSDDVVMAQQKKRALVTEALPRYLHAMWSVVDEDPTERRHDRIGGTKAANAAYRATTFNYYRCLDQTNDPMFWLFVRMLEEKLTRFMDDEKTAVEMSGLEALPMQAFNALGSSLSDLGKGETLDVALSSANCELAFAHFTQNSQRYLRLIVEYLPQYVAPEYVKPDAYLMLVLQKVLQPAHDDVLTGQSSAFDLDNLDGGKKGPVKQLTARGKAAGGWLAHKVHDLAAPRGDMLAAQAKALIVAERARVSDWQDAFIEFGGPKMLMLLLSLAEPPAAANGSSGSMEAVTGTDLAFFQMMVPKAIDFGNALLWGGNAQVQNNIFDTFVAKKQSFESYKEEGFLRSLHYQLRLLQRKLLRQVPAEDAFAVDCGHTEVYDAARTDSAGSNAKSVNGNYADRFAAELHQSSTEHAALMRAQQRAIALLVFIQNLVEGHDKKHQEFLCYQPGVSETVNLVKGVGAFYMSLFNEITPELQTDTIHTPLPFGGHASNGAASFSVVAWEYGINFKKLRLLVPVLAQCLRTMQELCQGPCGMNQVALLRSGVAESFPRLFQFCAALQLRRPVAAALRKRMTLLRPEDEAAFRETWHACNVDTSPMVAPNSQESSGKPSKTSSRSHRFPRVECADKWLGSDPVLVYLLTRLSMSRVERHAALGEESDHVLGVWPDDYGATNEDTDSDDDSTDDSGGRKNSSNVSYSHGAVSGFVGNMQRLGSGLSRKLSLNSRSNIDAIEAAKLRPRAAAWCDSRDRTGGWIADKAEFVHAMQEGQPISSIEEGNIYRDVRGLVDDFVGLEASLVVFVQALVHGSDSLQGGDVEAEVAASVKDSCFSEDAMAYNENGTKATPAAKTKADEAAQFVVLGSKASGGESAARSGMHDLHRTGGVAEAAVVHAALNWMVISGQNSKSSSPDSADEVEAEASIAHDMSLAYYILLESMCDVAVMPHAAEKRYRDLLVEIGLEPAKEVARVEVMGKDNLVNVLYFPKPKVVMACWDSPEVDNVRTTILYPDDMTHRNNAEEKLQNFLDEAEELIDVMDHEFKLLEMEAGKRGRVNQLVSTIAQQYWMWSAIQLILTLMLNGLLLSFISYDDDGSFIIGKERIYRWPVQGYLLDQDFGYFNRLKSVLVSFTTLPALHLICAFLTLLSYSMSMGIRRIQSGLSRNPRNALRVLVSTKKMRAMKLVLKKIMPRPLFSVLAAFFGYFIFEAGDTNANDNQGDDTSAEELPSLYGHNSQSGMTKLDVTLPRWFWIVRYYFVDPNQSRANDWRAGYHLAFVGLSIAGILYTPLVYVACMADIMRVSPTMRYIGRSLTKNLDQVMVTVVFMLLLLYLFAAIGFNNNYSYDFEGHVSCRDNFDPESDDEQSCGGDFFTWLRLHVDYGVINPMVWNDVEGPISSASGTVFGFVYYFFINLVITAIVSGIIIDTFAEMRVNRQAVAEDLRTSCFVCNIDREDFEQYGVRFDTHIRDDHNMWKYVWLMVHLREKDPVLYTGLEMHVAPLLKAHNTRAMPLKKSRSIQGKKVRDRATLPTLLTKVNGLGRFSSQLAQQMAQLLDKVGELSSAVEKNSEASKIAAQVSRDEASRLAANLLEKESAQNPSTTSASEADANELGAAAGKDSGAGDRVENSDTASTQKIQKGKSSKRLFRGFRRDPN